MGKIISVLNPKGGVGKSTLVASMARHCLNNKLKVLIVDTDPQESVSNITSLGDHVVVHTKSNIDSYLKAHIKDYDIILIDGAAKLQETIVGALKASDFVLVPISASWYDLNGSHMLLELLAMTNKPAAVVLTKIDERSSLKQAVINELNKYRSYLTTQGKPFDILKSYTTHRVQYIKSLEEGNTPLDNDKEKVCTNEINNIFKEIVEVLYGSEGIEKQDT